MTEKLITTIVINVLLVFLNVMRKNEKGKNNLTGNCYLREKDDSRDNESAQQDLRNENREGQFERAFERDLNENIAMREEESSGMVYEERKMSLIVEMVSPYILRETKIEE